MDTSTDPSEPRSNTHLDIAKVKDAYLNFTHMVDILNIRTLGYTTLRCILDCSALGRLNMVTSTDPCKPRSATELDILKLEDAYLKFTQGVCIANKNFQPQAPQHLGAYQTRVKMGLCKLQSTVLFREIH